MRNVTKKSAALLLGLAVIGGGGLIRAQVEKASPMQRGMKSGDLMELYARQAHQALLLQKTPVKHRPARTAEQEVILQEDFSGLTGGTEAEPGAEVGTYTVDGNSAWPDDITSTPGWWGIGTFAVDGSLGLCYPGMGGVVSTGPMNMYGNLHVSFRAKAREGNKEGSNQLLMVSITEGDKDAPTMSTPEGFIPINLKVEDGWQEFDLNFRNPNKGDDSRLQINGMTYSPAGFVIDDIKITRDYEFCLPPTDLACSDFTDDGFTISWEPGAENTTYLFSLAQEKKLTEAFDGIETFEASMLPYWNTTGTIVAEGGADNSRGLRLDDGQKLEIAFGGGRLADLKVFARGEGFGPESEAVVRVIGFIGDQEEELATIAVRNLVAGGEELNLRSTFSSNLYYWEGIRLVADDFADGQYCVLDNVTYKASPACERTVLKEDEPVAETSIALTGLDPENEYYVGLKGVKNADFISDFVGYYYVPGMPAPKVLDPTDVEKRGAYTANWTPSPKAIAYTVNNYMINTIAEDQENYVVIRDDFSKADDAVQAAVDQLYFDDWTDCKGWHTDMLPDNYWTMSLADAGSIGALGLAIYSPVVSLDNGDGKFTVRFKVKAFGGEKIAVYSNGQVQYYDFAEVNPGGDPYAFEEHEVEMEFDNGSEAQSIIIAGTYYTVLLDWFEITQNVKAGDKVLRFAGLADLTGHDAAEHRFTGLQNDKDITYAYNVVAYGEYMGQQFNSVPSELKSVDLNNSGVGELVFETAVTHVAGVKGGIAIELSESAMVNVYTAAGMHAAQVNANAGKSIINLPAGIYVVRIGDHTVKTVVK